MDKHIVKRVQLATIGRSGVTGLSRFALLPHKMAINKVARLNQDIDKGDAGQRCTTVDLTHLGDSIILTILLRPLHTCMYVYLRGYSPMVSGDLLENQLP